MAAEKSVIRAAKQQRAGKKGQESKSRAPKIRGVEFDGTLENRNEIINQFNIGQYATAIVQQRLKPIKRVGNSGIEQFGNGWRELALALALDGLTINIIRYYALGGLPAKQYYFLIERNEEFAELAELWQMASQAYMEALGSANLLEKAFNNGLYLFMMKSRFKEDYGDDMAGAVERALEKLGVSKPTDALTQEQMVKIAAAIRSGNNTVVLDHATIN